LHVLRPEEIDERVDPVRRSSPEAI
jgi:hypothetical protein